MLSGLDEQALAALIKLVVASASCLAAWNKRFCLSESSPDSSACALISAIIRAVACARRRADATIR
ncbi:unnamed protein product [Schistosoma mattheei]|uniref:Transposase n=2 Tax=Schistosoma TaxID=6181 RepID=A0A183JKM2_9TREM|nr:unnamed protein product [Schistosoma curassoni]VDP29394.1 unnamed protein product [Schistosoma mattheei]